MDKEVRKESSVPVQSRVSIVDLAKLDTYWMRVEGVAMRTMSQLVSWSVAALCEVVESNGKMPGGIDSVADAHKYLTSRGLYQQSLKRRSQSRISAALGFESLRKQGVDPAVHSTRAHKTVHSRHSIEAFDGDRVSKKSDIDWDEVNKRIAEEKEKEKEQSVEEALENARGIGALAEDVSEEEFHDGLRERDKEIIDRENTPIDELEFPVVEDE